MTTKDKVEAFLRYSQTYRDSDMRLFLDFWAKEGLVLTPQQRHTFLEQCTPPESIRRSRQELQAAHEELAPSDKVSKQRKKKETEHHSYYAQRKANQLTQEQELAKLGLRFAD